MEEDRFQYLQVTNQLTFCAWIYPSWSRWTNSKIGIFEIRNTDTLHYDEKIVTIYLIFDENGELKLEAAYVHLFTIDESINSVNILRCDNCKLIPKYIQEKFCDTGSPKYLA